MNYALAIYESGLQYLLEQLGKGHPTYSKALLLQTRLQENITRSQHADTSTQRADRERIVAELNDLTRQVLDISFVELCLSSSLLFTYIMDLQKAVQFAYDFFSTKTDIWPDQCERVNESLRKPGAIRDEVTLDVSETDIATASLLVELALLKESLSELIRLIDGFRIVCRKETTQAMRQKQQICHKLMVLIQSLKQLDLASDGLISKYHEELQANIGSNISGKESQLSLQTQKFQQNSFVVQPTSLITDRTIPSKLREAMLIAYNLADLELLCANLNIRYADLGDGPLDLKIQRLIEYCQHRGMYEALIQEVLKERPHLEALL